MRSGPLLLLAGALCFSTTGCAQALAPAGATPYVIGALRLAEGFGALFCWCALKRTLPFGQKWSGREIVLNVLPATLALVGFQLCFFKGILDAGIGVGTVASIGTTPIMVALLALVLLKEKPATAWYGATFLAILGLVLLNWQSMREGGGFALGMPLAAGFCYACYYVFSKPLSFRHPPETIMLVLFGLGGLLISPVYALFPLGWLATWRGFGIALYLGVVATALAYTLTLKGLKTTRASTASTIGLAEPLAAACLGIFFLGEAVNAVTLVAMGCMLLGVLLLALFPGRSQERQDRGANAQRPAWESAPGGKREEKPRQGRGLNG